MKMVNQIEKWQETSQNHGQRMKPWMRMKMALFWRWMDVVQLKECGEAEKGREQSGIGCRAELNCAY